MNRIARVWFLLIFSLIKNAVEKMLSKENSTALIFSDDAIPKTVKFWIYLIVLIPSIICSLTFMIYVIFNRTARNAIQNHVIVIVIFIGLIYEMTLYPWMLYYYQYDGIWNRSMIFCSIWGFFDWGVYYVQTMLFAWATIERHILIFHDKWVSTKIKQFFVHYLPLVLLLVYSLIFYIIVSFFPPCENTFDNSDVVCVDFCFSQNHVLVIWDILFHQTLPNLIIVIFSTALLIRILYRKYRIHQAIHWRRNRKMTIQLLSISILYLFFAFPIALMNLIYFCGLSENVGIELFEYILFFNYLMLLFLPFACVLSLPELLIQIKRILHLRRHNRLVVPTM